uniref:Uncharacterized protein n=1 Tax=Trieres chinensis TaxID=1514140 RepID=A0A7S2EMA8_TRICV|mmetsp:Transcript_28860/g.59084  ORF Transcript_28860/g.59084 Transcript_28860/m.59084 type:complete len:107 (+) Transcript_28860:199-519(+)|eukprot:CAMPEP_0183290804 /NCGR_PEP_ID=MMETSP0160_2-20130417/394_1 /TAXON_ID=2839 ORGANISM="Odontella Sinensis, Strain Grunow 1884" /NCGR_SAMPLE_ID=MMETSP0160_2 /ASSEMBLY_ACC=CAM_ASM_000250 /LENGTH=106 /DNA_ID=CAMNT_0025451469 /DNA_START=197 /DNA_END=517 /DNA_ORIENTATION=+
MNQHNEEFDCAISPRAPRRSSHSEVICPMKAGVGPMQKSKHVSEGALYDQLRSGDIQLRFEEFQRRLEERTTLVQKLKASSDPKERSKLFRQHTDALLTVHESKKL